MSELTPFQALITGAVMGALHEAGAKGPFLIDVEPVMEGSDYTNQVLVTGRESGEQLMITVSLVPSSLTEGAE